MSLHWKHVNVDERRAKVDERRAKVDERRVKVGKRSAVVSACGLAKSCRPTCPPSKHQNTGTGEAEGIRAPSKPLTTPRKSSAYKKFSCGELWWLKWEDG